MALRVTQQNVDVLSEATGGKLRVTQFYVEVLGEPGTDQEVSQSLGITDAASQVTVPGGIDLTASSALALTDTASPAGSEFDRSISDPISFVDVGSGVNNVEASASSALAFADQCNQQFVEVASNLMTLTDTALPGLYEAAGSSALAFTDEAISSVKSPSASSALAFTDLANVSGFFHVSSALALTDLANSNIKQVSASSALALTDSHTKVLIHTFASVLALDDDVARLAVFRRALASSLDLVQTAAIFIERDGVLCNYSPFIGSGPFTFTNVPPTLTPGTLTLFWPYVAPSLTVVLRNPEFGNKISFNANRINRKSRGGTKQVFRKETWPKFRTLQMDISVLTTAQIEQFRGFLITSLGQEIGLMDHEGRTWRGIITTPDTESTQQGGGSCGQYATSFQFEGELA